MSITEFVIQPEAEKKLVSSGLAAKIDEAVKKKEVNRYFGHLWEDTAIALVEEMDEKGVFKTEKPEVGQDTRTNLLNIANDPENYLWTIRRPNEKKEKFHLNPHFIVLSGYQAMDALPVEDMHNFARYGFASFADLLGTAGAYIKSRFTDRLYEGGIWRSEVDGHNFVSEITGDSNGDFRFFRTDVTPYECIDPFGNRVSYRPVTETDRTDIFGYHSQEPPFLAALMHFVDQEKVPSKILNPEGYKIFLQEFSGAGQQTGLFGDFGYSGHGVENELISHEFPIPRLDENNAVKENERTSDYIGSNHSITYGVHVGHNGDFVVMAYEKGKRLPDRLSLRMPASEIDDAVRALFIQTLKGRGRTSAKHLKDMLDYRYSEAFEKDMAQIRSMK